MAGCLVVNAQKTGHLLWNPSAHVLRRTRQEASEPPDRCTFTDHDVDPTVTYLK